ncbi:MAG: argininosuccinate synthase [Vulcanimicrobiota bacterium]
MSEKVVLAYSGGLDTSCILKWLMERGHEVVAFIGDVGQQEDFQAVKEKALAIGASEVHIEDLKKEFVTDFIFPSIKSNALYEGRYLLGTSLARPCIARSMLNVADRVGAKFLSHGATGKGNDQVRFELAFYALRPDMEVIAPWRMKEFLERFQGRTDLMNYCAQHNIPVDASPKSPYSMDENLFHISYESGILEDPAQGPSKDMFRMTVDPTEAPDQPEFVTIAFVGGVPVRLTTDEGSWSEPLELFQACNALGRKHGIGRIDIVENRFIGIKSRGVYETPGGTILREAHLDIEGIAMDREVMKLRDMLSPRFSELVYNGFWFSPEMEFLMAAMDKAQELIDGEVKLQLYKGRALPVGRSSPSSLYNKDLASMEIEGGFDPRHSEGFIRINSIRLKAHRAIMESRRQ